MQLDVTRRGLKPPTLVSCRYASRRDSKQKNGIPLAPAQLQTFAGVQMGLRLPGLPGGGGGMPLAALAEGGSPGGGGGIFFTRGLGINDEMNRILQGSGLLLPL